MRVLTVFIAAHAFLSFWQCATAKELIGVQVSRGPNIYSGSNACAVFSDNKVVYHNEVRKPEGGNALVMFETEDRSQMLWPSLIKKFDLDKLVRKLDGIDTESEEATAGSPSYRLMLFYSDKSSKSYRSLSNQGLLDLYCYLEEHCWDEARDCVPIIKHNYSSDFFKNAITAEEEGSGKSN